MARPLPTRRPRPCALRPVESGVFLSCFGGPGVGAVGAAHKSERFERTESAGQAGQCERGRGRRAPGLGSGLRDVSGDITGGDERREKGD